MSDTTNEKTVKKSKLEFVFNAGLLASLLLAIMTTVAENLGYSVPAEYLKSAFLLITGPSVVILMIVFTCQLGSRSVLNIEL
jgi:hypothetical protein